MVHATAGGAISEELNGSGVVLVKQLTVGDVDGQLAVGQVTRQRDVARCTAVVQLDWGVAALRHAVSFD